MKFSGINVGRTIPSNLAHSHMLLILEPNYFEASKHDYTIEGRNLAL